MGKYQLDAGQMAVFSRRQKANSLAYSDRQRRGMPGARAVDRRPRRRDLRARGRVGRLRHIHRRAPDQPRGRAGQPARRTRGADGAPNLVRGGSHSGNIAAAELARQGVLDILSSDYYPASLLPAGQEHDYDLPRAVAAGLADRGEPQVGLRADLLQARVVGARAVVRQKRGTGGVF